MKNTLPLVTLTLWLLGTCLYQSWELREIRRQDNALIKGLMRDRLNSDDAFMLGEAAGLNCNDLCALGSYIDLPADAPRLSDVPNPKITQRALGLLVK